MRYCDSTFGHLLKPIGRRQFQATVDRFDGDAYDKSFTSWDHLVVLVFAQLSHAGSLRALETSFNASAQHHYHLGTDEFARATLSDANARCPIGVFADTFTILSGMADRQTRREGAEMVRLIDASPIPLGKVCRQAKWNGRIRGMKMHVVYDPKGDVPRCVEITPANVNDVEVGRARTDAMQFTWDELVAYAARDTRLRPGDVLGSGTLDRGGLLELGPLPGGRWIEPGDVVTITAEGLGALTTPVA